MVISALSVLVVLTSGLVAGVLFGVALANVPSLASMTPRQYVFTQQILDRRFEPAMPLLVFGSITADVVLLALSDGLRRPLLFGAAAVLLAGVAAVSQFGNVPLLARWLRGLDPDALPADWRDPREPWRRWHLLRTALSLAAVVATAAAVVG